MPLDSEQKRSSAMNAMGGPRLVPMPTVNNVIDSFDRLHLLGFYSMHGPIAREATLAVAAVASLDVAAVAELSRAAVAEMIIQ